MCGIKWTVKTCGDWVVVEEVVEVVVEVEVEIDVEEEESTTRGGKCNNMYSYFIDVSVN